jgi:hypothetical protein
MMRPDVNGSTFSTIYSKSSDLLTISSKQELICDRNCFTVNYADSAPIQLKLKLDSANHNLEKSACIRFAMLM